MKKLTRLAAAGAIALCATQAHALTFGFSFSNSVGGTAGTVTGTISGLADNTAGQAATSLTIDSVPGGLGGSFLAGNDAVTWATQALNSFDVSGGEITAANFAAQQAAPGTSNTFCLTGFISCVGFGADLGQSQPGISLLSLDNGLTQTANDGGFFSVTFTNLDRVAAVPLPAAFPLLLAGLGALGLSRTRKRAA